MAALLEWSESNDDPEEVTDGVTDLAFGTVDQTGLVAGVGSGRISPGADSMQKVLRVHLTDLNESGGITRLRVYCDPVVAGITYFANASDDAGSYAPFQVLVYVPPDATTGPVPYALPVSDPGDPNLGIGGDLEGSLTAAGYSDYLYVQARAAVDAVEGTDPQLLMAYEGIA